MLEEQRLGVIEPEGLSWLADHFIDHGASCSRPSLLGRLGCSAGLFYARPMHRLLLALRMPLLVSGAAVGKGLPTGNLTSQHFANLYLGPIDHLILGDLSVSGYLRYMDDMVLFGSEAELRRAWGAVDAFVESRLGLRLRHEVCRLEPVVAGVPFLGFRIWPRLIRLDAARVRRFRRKMRRARAAAAAGDARAVATIDSLLGWVAVGDTRALCQSMERRAGDHHRADLGEGRWARTA